MKALTTLLLLISFSIISAHQAASAQSIFDWYKFTTVICVATAEASHPSKIVYNGTVPVQPIETRFDLKDLAVKGEVDKTFIVDTYNENWGYPPLPAAIMKRMPHFASFQPGQTYLLFLTRAPQFGSERPGLPLRLVTGSVISSFHPSLFRLGNHTPILTSTDSPLLNILHILMASLHDPSKQVQEDAILGLSGYGSFLWDGAKYPNLALKVDGMWQGDTGQLINPLPDKLRIISLLKNTVVPELIQRLHTAKPDTRQKLLITLAFLQDTSVIPELISEPVSSTPTDWSAIDALSNYGVPAALPLLEKGFLNTNPDIAKACINAVVVSYDPSSAPAVVGALLHGVNDDVRFTAYLNLPYVSGAPDSDCGTADFATHEKEIDQYWQNWLDKGSVHTAG